MTRHVRRATIAVVLLTAALASGQTAPIESGRTATVQVPGQPPRRCRVVKSWRQSNGAMAYQVRVEETGEMLVVTENGPPQPAAQPPAAQPPAHAPVPAPMPPPKPAVVDPLMQPRQYTGDPLDKHPLPGLPAGGSWAPPPQRSVVARTAVEPPPPPPIPRAAPVSSPQIPPPPPAPPPQPAPVVVAPPGEADWARPKSLGGPVAPVSSNVVVAPTVPRSIPSGTQVVVPNGPPVRVVLSGRPVPTGPAAPLVVSARPSAPQASPAPVVTASYAAPARPSANDPHAVAAGLIADLRGQWLPSLREVAAEEMTRCYRQCPEYVIFALMESARSDPAPTVRACSTRCLGELHFRTLSCRALLQDLRSDEDPRVRIAAEAALNRFNQP